MYESAPCGIGVGTVGFDVGATPASQSGRNCQKLWTAVEHQAAFLMPSTNSTPALTSFSSAQPLSFRQCFSADWHSLKTIVRHAWRLPQPLVLAVRSRTVAKVLSRGLVVRRCA